MFPSFLFIKNGLWGLRSSGQVGVHTWLEGAESVYLGKASCEDRPLGRPRLWSTTCERVGCFAVDRLPLQTISTGYIRHFPGHLWEGWGTAGWVGPLPSWHNFGWPISWGYYTVLIVGACLQIGQFILERAQGRGRRIQADPSDHRAPDSTPGPELKQTLKLSHPSALIWWLWTTYHPPPSPPPAFSALRSS